MKKRIVSIIVSVCMVIACFSFLPQGVVQQDFAISASAATSGKCGANVYWTLNNGTLTIKGTGTMYNVTQDKTSPFYCNKSINKVVVANGVTSIGSGAFVGCENLITVSLPGSIQTIGDGAFSAAII